MTMYKKPSQSGKGLIEQMNRTEVGNGALAMWHLGQEGMAIKGAGSVCYFDPYLTDSINERTLGQRPRQFESPLEPGDVTNADIVFITHDHGDHLDAESIRGIAASSPQAVYVTPVHGRSKLLAAGIEESQIISANSGKPFRVREIDVLPIACKHEEFETDAEGNHRFLGYVLTVGGVTFYHAGDTVGYAELATVLSPLGIEIACLPINGQDWKRSSEGIMGNLNYRESADLCAAIGADLLVPMHYDLFAFNTENPAYFVDYLHSYYPGQKFKMFQPGERMLYLSEKL